MFGVFLTFVNTLQAESVLMLATCAQVRSRRYPEQIFFFFFFIPGTVRNCRGKEATERQIEGRAAVGG